MESSKDAADTFLNSLEFLKPKSSHENRIQLAQDEITVTKTILDFLLETQKTAKSVLLAAHDPEHKILLARLEETIEMHRVNLNKLQMLLEIKKDYATHVIKQKLL
ncbi:hypothetical protein CROQUDRAFT_133340 [Cronartium quercuum f. sp. fusiforme G11]|uniref:Uncharacterized protein n=1 Tax=Cronartium quercuum f. sp. fusiforme G11 TaxID=708437 RepID=A0A9P6TBZ1_9BASI|nr:hypothetical protein CROQUDRAFT_133340 [Cronartium quercuum f. sp. fusiforme G11]